MCPVFNQSFSLSLLDKPSLLLTVSHRHNSELSFYSRMFQHICFNINTLWNCSVSFRLCVEGGSVLQNTVKYMMSVFTQWLRCVVKWLRAGKLLMYCVCVFCVFEEHRHMKCGFSKENVCVRLEMRPQSMREKVCLSLLSGWFIMNWSQGIWSSCLKCRLWFDLIIYGYFGDMMT